MIAGIYIIHEEFINERFLRLFVFICYSYLGFIFVLFSVLLFYDITSLVFYLFNTRAHYSYIFISILFFTVIIYIYGFFEANSITLKTISLSSSKINRKIKIAYISDMHLGITTLNQRVNKVYKQLEKLNADIIISGGDFIDGKQNNIDRYIMLFKNISAKYGKFAVLGNHEYYAGKNYSENLIKEAGFTLLNNESVKINDLNLVITGIEDIINDSSYELRFLKRNYDEKCFNIYVKHRPVINSVTTDYFNLQLSGHTHKGQIFPFGIFVKIFFKYITGLNKISNESFIYVSNGVLTWGPPIRILAKPEITFIILRNQ
jgi:predicted MPP superfamily phosphohydrolase